MTGKRVTIGRTGDVTVLNPLLYTDLNTGEVVNRIFDHLVLTDERQQYIAGRLLNRWEQSDDGLTWHFHMRPGALWHDGVEVTAADAAFTFQTILDPATGSKRRPELMVGERPIAFDAVDRYVLRAKLPSRFAPFLAALAWRPLIPRHRYAGAALADNPVNWAPVGAGAFSFGEWLPGDRLTMRANLKYHLGRPPLDEVVWRCFPDQDNAVAALADGAVDYVPGVPPTLVPQLEAMPSVRLSRSVDATFTYLGFHMAHPLFADSRVRHAICHAVDREALVRDVLRAEGQVAHSMVTPISPWHNPAVRRYAYEPALAAQLLAEAGWRTAPGGSRINERGERLGFTLLTVAGDRVKEQAAAAVAACCAHIGIQVRVTAYDMARLLQEFVYPRRYEAVLMALAPNADPAYLHAFYHSAMLTPAGWNRLAYHNPRVDQLLEESQTAMDPAQRKRVLDEAQALIVADAPQLFLFHPTVVDGANRRLVLPALPATPANRFMYLHRWDMSE